jgi:signal transduction histidine kinase
MKLLIALYFFILATIQLGLLLGIYHYYHSKNLVKPSPYWLSSLIVSILGLAIFGGGIFFITDIARPDFNFTIANTFFYSAALLQLFFCRSLNQPISKQFKLFSLISVLVFAVVFELMRQYGNFEVRTVVMCVVAITFYALQLSQLQLKRKQSPSSQILYLQYATMAEVGFALGRLSMVISLPYVMRNLDQIPQLLILFTIGQLVMNTLAYIAIGGYWAEKVALANAKSQMETYEIKALLEERESLIANLLRVNKTAATGALAASIAHELNQPLGASNLNLQFLKKKLDNASLDPQEQHQVLDALMADNLRASNIIKSLRSIFSDGKMIAEQVDIKELIDSVLVITKPEILLKNIQVVLALHSKSLINIDRTEIVQLLLNLINNAVQALSQSHAVPKTISIESHDVVGGVEFCIADNGQGIDQDAQSHLFKLLACSEKKAGMGLGLWLCQHIVIRHGGQIRYQAAEGGGAQFIVFLPLKQL